MRVDAPLLLRQVRSQYPVVVHERAVACETGTQSRSHIFARPVHNCGHRFPEAFPGDIGLGDVGTRDDQRIESVALEITKVLVVTLHMFSRIAFAVYAFDGERVNVELSDPVTRAY